MRLTSLHLHQIPPVRDAATEPSRSGLLALLNAIRDSSNRIRLLSFHLPEQYQDVLDAIAQSLSSSNNRIEIMGLFGTSPPASGSAGPEYPASFRRAARTSNLKRLNLGWFQSPFVTAFNDEWFRVLIALTSVHHVPRLRKSSSLGILPVVEFIIRIAETLDWPLDRLR